MSMLNEMPPQIFCTDNETFEFRQIKDIITWVVPNKPNTGLWTSSALTDSPFLSPWQEWCANNDYHCGVHHFSLIPKTNLKVFEPDSLSDLRTIEPELPILPPSIDFAWYAREGYNGFHVSDRILNLPSDDIHPFHGWDCESTVWFNYDWISSIKKISCIPRFSMLYSEHKLCMK